METVKQKQERRSIFISRALSLNMGGDEDELRREAQELFDEKNPIENCSDYLQK